MSQRHAADIPDPRTAALGAAFDILTAYMLDASEGEDQKWEDLDPDIDELRMMIHQAMKEKLS